MKIINNQLVTVSDDKVLRFLINHPSRFYMEKEIVEGAKISKTAVNESLKRLAKNKKIIQEKKGRMSFSSVDLNDPVIKSSKRTTNVLLLIPLVEKLKEASQKIILFGSFANGTNIEESDIDLFILTNQPKKVQEIIQKSSFARKIQLITRTLSEFIGMDKKESPFYQEINKGVILWENNE